MNGQELLRLLDFVDGLQKQADGFEENVKAANDEKTEMKLRTRAEVHKEISENLKNLLRKINQYEGEI